jgi:hypothetical protein
MSAKTFLSSGAWTELERVLPLERWFCKQREGLGYEAWTYAMIRVARAPKILQWGFDETKLDGVSTMNQWVLLQEGDNAPEVVTIEAAGLTVGGTAKRTAEHVQKSWDLGQEAVLLVRAELGPDVCDELVCLAGGGVLLHKIQGAMHDTCPTANLVPYLVNDLRATSGKLYFGDEEWDALPDDEKPWFDYLCGNHSRNLPLDEWNREYEAYIKDELGEAIVEVQKAGGGRTRVEGSGILLLRAMCRLTHMGNKEYTKGDGRRFHDYLKLEYPDVKSRCVGRAEMSKRQDWCAEVSWNFFNLIKPIITFTVAMCAVDANILRDAVLVRLENIRFEAYVHVNALMWKVAFAELRALTNRKAVTESGLGLNPMELNDLYDHLWNVGVLLQSENCLEVFQEEYRPWPKLHEGDTVSTQFYARLETTKVADMAELHEFTTRKDVVRYTQELRTQLALFGTGIKNSLQRTMGHYLQVDPAPPHSLLRLSHPSQSTPLNLGNERKVP